MSIVETVRVPVLRRCADRHVRPVPYVADLAQASSDAAVRAGTAGVPGPLTPRKPLV